MAEKSFYKIRKTRSLPHSSTRHKTVSAVIPNYNYARFLKERVDSIVNQKYPISELIILDDCSIDESPEVINRIIQDLVESHPKLKTKVIVNPENSGNVFRQWAKAFKYASSEFIWICEADDTCSPYFLKKVMPAFGKDQEVVVAYANSKMISEKGRRLIRNLHGWADYRRSGHYKHSFITDGREELANYLVINNTILNVSSVVFRNNPDIPFEKYLKEAERFHLAGDWYFYSKVLLHGKLAYNAKPLNSYRSHSGSVSKETDNLTHYQEIVRVQDSIMKDVQIPKEAENLVIRRRKELKRDWKI